MNRDNVFDLPELLACIGSYLPTGSLYQCIQVSKSWNAVFLPHLWRTFTEEPVSQRSSWSLGLTSAIQLQLTAPQHLEWYKDVYRRHAKYIRHLSIATPTMLDACLEGAFEPLRRSLLPSSSSSPSPDLEDVSMVGSSGTTKATAPPSLGGDSGGDSATLTDVGAGLSLITNLESLTINFLRAAIDFYFPAHSERPVFTSATGFGVSSTTGFGAPSTTGFGLPSTTGSGLPSTTGFGLPSTTGFGLPSTTGSGLPSTTGSGLPSTTGSGLPSTTGFGLPSTTGFGLPSTTSSGLPSTTGFGLPSTTGFGLPSYTGFGLPSTTGFGTTSNNNDGDVNNNSSDSNSDATMDPEAPTTTTMRPPPDSEKVFFKACKRLILNNPLLRTLSCAYTKEILQNLQDGVYGNTVALRSLKYLTCTTKDGLIPNWSPPSVTHLTLSSVFGFRFNSFSSASGGRPRIETTVVHAALESLEVPFIESPAQLEDLLAQAPNLKTLTINGFIINGGFGGGLVAAASILEDRFITWPATQITVLKFRGIRGAFGVAAGFEGFFACLPLLVEYHDDLWSFSVSAQLVKHCPLLEVISMQLSSGFAMLRTASKSPRRFLGIPVNDTVSDLLTGLPKLRVLNIPQEAITAENILRRPWVCLDLEEFRCQIAEVPFLTKKDELLVQDICQRETAGTMDSAQQQHIRTDEEERLMELNERCVSTRRQIMSQLSKLTSLKYLSLSPDFRAGREIFEQRLGGIYVYKSERDGRNYIRYNDVLPDTLHFRLDSGLDQLASLENLEYLSFESMDHQMGTAEIEWIARHFPRLKEMRGLVAENHVGMEPDPENDALVALIRRLRPDIAQTQSFVGY